MRLGPTFRELCDWLKPYAENIWQTKKHKSSGKFEQWFHWQVNRLLDESSDYGSIVPVFSESLRVLRPGEASFEDRRLVAIIVSAAGPDVAVENLTARQRNKIIECLAESEWDAFYDAGASDL